MVTKLNPSILVRSFITIADRTYESEGSVIISRLCNGSEKSADVSDNLKSFSSVGKFHFFHLKDYQSYLFVLLANGSESHLRALHKTNTDLQLPKKTTNDGQKCFSYRGVKSWNVLPLEN